MREGQSTQVSRVARIALLGRRLGQLLDTRGTHPPQLNGPTAVGVERDHGAIRGNVRVAIVRRVPREVDLRIAAGTYDVITSYSIHYTKLYDLIGRVEAIGEDV